MTDGQGAMTDEQRAEVARLESIGYLAGSVPPPARSGVTVYDDDAAFDGYNFFTSGHFPGALLVDMRGNVLHEWSKPFDEVWPDYQDPVLYGRDVLLQRTYNKSSWRRAHLFENGDVLAIYEGLGLVKLDRDSKVVWEYLGGCHHDLEVTPDGTIYVLTREAVMEPGFSKRWPILEDHVSVLDADGNELRRVSLLDAFRKSKYAPCIARMQRRGDVMHTNTVELLDGSLADRIPAFAEGNLLISVLKIDAIAVLDMEREEIVWAMSGLWSEQHQPTVLPNDRLLIFDNRGERFEQDGGLKESRVFEFDPATHRVYWRYGGSGEDFYSHSCGSAARLPNGNTLITESDNGRAIEVDPDGQIVWEYVSPYRAGESGEFIATLFEIVRLPASFPIDWTRAGTDSEDFGKVHR